jgi:hypothetical protein
VAQKDDSTWFDALKALRVRNQGFASRKNRLPLVIGFVTTHILLTTVGEFVTASQLVESRSDEVCKA